MKRHILLLVTVLLLVTMVFVACNETEAPDGNTSAHQHTYGDVWAMDETNHWHAATCTDGTDCTSAKASVAAHTDADNNKVCDVCGYDYNHEHTYAAEWTADANGHAHAVTCGCTISAKDAANHIDANNDGVCDTCAYVGCTHTYNEAWAMNADSHWHAATCTHAVKADEAEHDYDDNGFCSVCGYYEDGEFGVDNAVEIGDLNSDKVNGGTVYFEHRSEASGLNQEVIKFAFDGHNYAMYDRNYTEKYYDIDEYGWVYIDYNVINHYNLLAGNSVFAVQMTNGSDYEKPYAPESGWVNGYKFDYVFGMDTTEEQVYFGTADLVSALYEEAVKSGNASEYVYLYDGKTYYVFEFSTAPMCHYGKNDEGVYVAEGAHCNDIRVTFTLGAGFNYENVVVSSNKIELDATLDSVTPATDTAEETPVFTYKRSTLIVTDNYTYTVAQTAGDRVVENKVTSEEILADEIDLVDADGNSIGDTLTVIEGKYYNDLFFIKAVSPETALISLDEVSFESTLEGLEPYYSSWSKGVALRANVPGEYSLTVNTLSASKTITLVVEPKPFTAYNIQVVNNNVYEDIDNTYSMPIVDSSVSLILSAKADASGDHPYTATLAEGTTGVLALQGDGTYMLTATEVGTYTVTFTSTENAEITATVDIEVTLPATLESLGLAGNTYEADTYDIEDPVDMTFVFGTDTVVITNNTLDPDPQNPLHAIASGTYNVAVEADGTLVITDAEGNLVDFEISDPFGYGYSIGISYWSYELRQLGGGSSSNTPFEPYGSYIITGFDNDFNEITLYTLTFNDWNGTVTIVDSVDGTLTGDFYCFPSEEDDGSYYLQTLDWGYPGVTFTNDADYGAYMHYDGNEYYMAEEESDVEAPMLNGTYNAVNRYDVVEYTLTFSNYYMLTITGENNPTFDGDYYFQQLGTNCTVMDSSWAPVSRITITYDTDASAWTIQIGMGMALTLVEAEGGAAGGDEAAIIEALEMAEMTSADEIYTIDFYFNSGTDNGNLFTYTYEVVGTDINITFESSYTGVLSTATFVYDNGTVVATLADSTTVVFS